MQHSTGKPTQKQAERMRRMTEEVGCIACRIRTGMMTHAEVHHIVEGGRRLGHDWTIPLCPWHHRGVCDLGVNWARERLGPSLGESKREFVAKFGSERDLMRRVNVLLAIGPHNLII